VRELAIEDEERQAAEVVPVQVGHRHGADRIRVQPLGLQCHQAGGTAVDQQDLPAAAEPDACLEAPAAAESIAAAREPHLHDTIVAHPGTSHPRHARVSA
jgi:hypothetical protein